MTMIPVPVPVPVPFPCSVIKAETFPLIVGIDTDELDSHVENFEEETIEFLIKVEETILDNE